MSRSTPSTAPPWDAAFPHEVYPAAEPEERMCDCMHPLEEHRADSRWLRIPCDQRNGRGERVCKCRDFACYEHPDNRCSEVARDD